MNFKNPTYYGDVNLKQDPSYHDYENFEITFGYFYDIRDQEKYEINQKIGRGKYSEVFNGIDTTNDQKVVIKILKPGQLIKFSPKK